MSNWWTRRMPAGVLAGGAGLAPEARRVGGVADRQSGGVEDLVAVEVRDRDLGGRDQVQVVAGDDVHLVFLVRDLAGADGGRGVDDGRRPDLGHAVLAGVDVEEPVDEGALERGAGTLVDREARAGDLRAAGVVDDVEGFGELPVGLAGPCRAAGRRVGADLAFDRLLDRKQLAPRPNGDVRLLAADRDVRVGRVRDAKEEVLDLGLDRRELGVDRVDPFAGCGRSGLQVRDLRPVRGRAALDRLADLLGRGVALGLERVALAEERPPSRVELERPIDDRRVLALVDRALADRRRRPRAAAATRRSRRRLRRARRRGLAKARRRRTRDRGSRAASLPAARSSGRGTRGRARRTRPFGSRPSPVAVAKIASCHASPASGRRASTASASAAR